MKHLRIEPLGTEIAVVALTNIAEALIEKGNNRVKRVCGGKGLCATCHVRVLAGADSLSALTEREKITLSRMTDAGANSRLGCQAKVIQDGCVIEVPDGIYLESLADLESLIGRRAEAPLCHPVTGKILVPSGKIIVRSIVMSLQKVDFDIVQAIKNSDLAV